MLLTKIPTILRINNQVIKVKLIWWFSVGDESSISKPEEDSCFRVGTARVSRLWLVVSEGPLGSEQTPRLIDITEAQ